MFLDLQIFRGTPKFQTQFYKLGSPSDMCQNLMTVIVRVFLLSFTFHLGFPYITVLQFQSLNVYFRGLHLSAFSVVHRYILIQHSTAESTYQSTSASHISRQGIKINLRQYSPFRRTLLEMNLCCRMAARIFVWSRPYLLDRLRQSRVYGGTRLPVHPV